MVLTGRRPWWHLLNSVARLAGKNLYTFVPKNHQLFIHQMAVIGETFCRDWENDHFHLQLSRVTIYFPTTANQVPRPGGCRVPRCCSWLVPISRGQNSINNYQNQFSVCLELLVTSWHQQQLGQLFSVKMLTSNILNPMPPSYGR